MKRLFTSESVTEGHPDKVSDQISDAVLDDILKQDPAARVACETFCTTGVVTVMGEITTTAYVDIPKIVREVVAEIGYTSSEMGFDAKSCAVMVSLDEQSPDIAQGVDKSLEKRGGEVDGDFETGAGDQGLMFGYACDETPELMPLGIHLSHRLAEKLTEVRKNGTLKYLRPDGKTQVTVEYDGDVPKRIKAIVVSSQHEADITLEQIRKDIITHVINPIISQNLIDDNTKIYVNPTGKFVVGGPMGDTGLTGRKIIVDTYGGYSRHGGGAFSGKDPTKVDRSASYFARYIAKNIVAAGAAKRAEVQLAYAIGVAKPVSIMVDTFGTGAVSDEKIAEAINNIFDCRPAAIIKHLNLRRPIYKNTASYGHFGRENADFTWEKTDKINEIKSALELK